VHCIPGRTSIWPEANTSALLSGRECDAGRRPSVFHPSAKFAFVYSAALRWQPGTAPSPGFPFALPGFSLSESFLGAPPWCHAPALGWKPSHRNAYKPLSTPSAPTEPCEKTQATPFLRNPRLSLQAQYEASFVCAKPHRRRRAPDEPRFSGSDAAISGESRPTYSRGSNGIRLATRMSSESISCSFVLRPTRACEYIVCPASHRQPPALRA
jgi:hypothetical protein